MPQPYLFPLAILGYRNNGYKSLKISDILREPYATQAAVYLDGEHDNYDSFFPKKTSELFTADFINNTGMDEINRILDDNSVKPWKNKCRFVMTHGSADETVYYQQAKNFADEQNKYGGNVTFVKTDGSHTGAGVFFFLRLYTELKLFN